MTGSGPFFHRVEPQVALVSRTGTFGAFERAARHKNYVVLEAWESEAYSLPAEYYVWGDPFYHKPFMTKAGSTGTASSVRAPQPSARPVDHWIACG